MSNLPNGWKSEDISVGRQSRHVVRFPPQHKPLFNRFVEKVFVESDGCWRWLGAAGHARKGYGNIYHAGKTRPAYRVAYELYRGNIPNGLELDHLCRHPYCVNPWHLEAVTHMVNMRRAMKTHCPQGHPYSGANVRIGSDGQRICRACDLARKHATARFVANKDKTHCPRGHEFTAESTGRDRGRRYCKICHREGERQRRLKLEHDRRLARTPEQRAREEYRAAMDAAVWDEVEAGAVGITLLPTDS